MAWEGIVEQIIGIPACADEQLAVICHQQLC